MSYEPYTWKGGDTVTAAKLNRMEQGIANNTGFLTCELDFDTGLLSITAQEVLDAFNAKIPIYGYANNNGGLICFTLNVIDTVNCEIVAYATGDELTLYYTNLSDYPSMQPPSSGGSDDSGGGVK